LIECLKRWSDPGYQAYYVKVFEGKWEEFDPWAGELRIHAKELPSPNVCTVFRSFQGWIALSKQGKGDGTLQVVPLLRETSAYLLMRAFQDDVGEEDPFCGAFPGKQHKIVPKWYDRLLKALVSIPTMNPGDTIWWHPDVIHAVEKEHKGSGRSSVFYIGAVPLCPKNARYLILQRETFLTGEASPDFPQEHKELSFRERAQLEDLSELGKCQMGFAGWPLSLNESQAQLQLLREVHNIIYSKPTSTT
jgi:hypothetical protein